MAHPVTIVIATFGDDRWQRLAMSRAFPSAAAQGCDVLTSHGPSLHVARNRGAADAAKAEWLVFLDADDELAPGYVDALLAAGGDLRAPAVQYVHKDGTADEPVLLDDRDIERMNPCVIGTMIRRNVFLRLGGFQDWPAWEDWDLFLRAVRRERAVIEHVPEAVYRAHVSTDSRNHTVPDPRGLMRRIKASA